MQSAGIGYSIGEGRRWDFYVIASFAVFAAMISLGEALPLYSLRSAVADVALLRFFLPILFLRAGEEFIISRTAAICCRGLARPLADGGPRRFCSVLAHQQAFELAHVILASIAGIFYERTGGKAIRSCFRDRSWLVDTTWHFFRNF